jgi:hypothetical protein
MSNWNWDLRDRFLQAARVLDVETECNWSYYKMMIPDEKIWCYLWHPANKMKDLSRNSTRDPQIALNHIRDNQDDFHIELDRDPRVGHGIGHLFPELWDNPTVDQIVNCVRRAQDAREVAELEFLDALEGED